MVTKRKKNPQKGGRKTLLTEKLKASLKLLYEKGLTDKEMAVCLGITEPTLHNWKKRCPKFFKLLKDWKLTADTQVEKSLFMSAKGFTVPAVHISNYQGDITETDIKRYYPPNPTSAIFWLKNRQPDKYRDRKEVTGADGGPLQVNVIDFGKLPKEKK